MQSAAAVCVHVPRGAGGVRIERSFSMSGANYRHGELRLKLLSLFAERPRHGYEIMQLLRTPRGGRYAPSAGAIYPRIQKLESEGLVEEIESGRRRIFAITQDGRDQLASRDSSAQKHQAATLADENLLREAVVDTLADLAKIQMRLRQITWPGYMPVRTDNNSLQRFDTSIEDALRSLNEILSDALAHVEARAERPPLETSAAAAEASKRIDENRWSK